MYLLAIIFPPAAVAICGKPWQAILSFFLMCIFWVPGVLYAFAVIAEHNADRRNKDLIGAIQGGRSRSRGRSREPEYEGEEPADPFKFQ